MASADWEIVLVEMLASFESQGALDVVPCTYGMTTDQPPFPLDQVYNRTTTLPLFILFELDSLDPLKPLMKWHFCSNYEVSESNIVPNLLSC